MRTAVLFFFLLISAFAAAQNVDVVRYRFGITLTDANDSLKGEATVYYTNKPSVDQAVFDLASVNKQGKGFKVVRIFSGRREAADLPFSQTGEKLTVKLPSINKNDTGRLIIGYEGVPADGLIIAKNKYGDRTFFADNWPNRAHQWLPCIDRPDDKASFEFLVAAPSHYGVVANGVKVEEREEGNGMKLTHWKEDIPLPTKVMVIGVARFATAVFADGPKDVPVSAWVYPQDSTNGFYDYAVTTAMVKFFSDYIAPFPYRKLANVQSKTIFGGMENASCIFYAESSVTGNRSEEDLYAHEIAHQWFGDMASEKSFAHLWLSEGFATYLTDIYFEHRYGKAAFDRRLQKERDEAIAFARTSAHPVVDTASDLMSLLNANSYQKGAWVLHMLRGEVGDSVFHKIIRAYYQGYKGRNADTRDFEAVAETVSGKDLKWFFDQWLYQGGLPVLNVSWTYKNGSVSISPAETDGKRMYKLPVEVKFIYKNGTAEKHLLNLVPDGHSVEAVPSKEQPVGIELDPDKKLLFRGGKVSEKIKSR